MKKFLSMLVVVFAFLTISSCKKEVMVADCSKLYYEMTQVDADLQQSANNIKSYQSQLANSSAIVRANVIKNIDKERQREKELQKRKAELVELTKNC